MTDRFRSMRRTQLVLNGVDIPSADSSAIYALEADHVFITLADGSENSLSNGGAYLPIDETSVISVPSKNLQISYLTLTAYDVSFWKIMVMGIIPVIFLVIGFMVWLKRRKA